MEYIFCLENKVDLDIHIIESLVETGFRYLTGCIRRYIEKVETLDEADEITKALVNMVKLYFTNVDMFPSATSELIACINTGDSMIIKILMDEGCFDPNILSDERTNFEKMDLATLDLILKYLGTHMPKCKKIIPILFTIYMNKLDENASMECIVKFYEIFNILLQNDDVQKVFISEISSILNSYKKFYINEMSVPFMRNTMVTLMYMFITGEKDNIDKIDPDYIKSKHCTIDYSSKSTDRSDFNFLTKIYFISMYSIMCMYNTLIPTVSRLTASIQDMENKISYYTNGMLQPILIENIFKKIGDMRKLLEKVKSIIDDKVLVNEIKKVIHITLDIVKINEKPVWDDTLEIIHTFMKYNNMFKDFNDDITEFIVDLIGTKKFTSNPHMRSSFLKSVYKNISKSHNENIIKAVMSLYNDIGLSKDEGMQMDKITTSIVVFDFMLDHVIEAEDKYNYNKLMSIVQENSYKFKMFVNFVVKDNTSIMNTLFEFISEFVEIEDDYELQVNTSIVRQIVNYCVNTLKLIRYFISSDGTRNPFKQREIVLALRTCLENIIVQYYSFINDQDKQKRIKDIESYTYTKLDINKIISNMFSVIVESYKCSEVSKLLFNEDLSYDKMFDLMEYIQDNEPLFLAMIDVSCNIASTKTDTVDLDYPNEFLDAIMYTPLNDPVILPISKQVVNRESILQYILTDNTDPFNRTKLTVDMLEEYNSRKDVREEIDSIMKKKVEWEKENI